MARTLLGDTVPLKDAIQQWANLGAFVDGLHRGDFDLIGRSLVDTIAEPRRAPLVPGLAAIKRAAAGAGALGCSLSGSGPSLFALCRNAGDAERVAAAMTAAVRGEIGGDPQTYVSSIAPRGARVIVRSATTRVHRERRERPDHHHALRNHARRGSRHVARMGALRRARPRRQPLHAGDDRPVDGGGDRGSSVAFAGGDWHPRPPALHRRRDFRGHAGVDRRRGAEFSDSTGRSRAGRACARALSRPDARVQGHRRPRDGASDLGAARSRGADLGSRGDVRRHGQRRRTRLLPGAAHPRASCSIPTAASAHGRRRR